MQLAPARDVAVDPINTLHAAIKKDQPKARVCGSSCLQLRCNVPLCLQVTVDIAKRLSDVGLARLPQCCWPSPALVNELATKAAALQRAKVTNPFVFVKLQEWLPDFAKEHKEQKGKEKGELVSSARCPAV